MSLDFCNIIITIIIGIMNIETILIMISSMPNYYYYDY